MMRLQVRARVRDQREARRVRFGESVEREGGDRLDDLVLRLLADAALRHPRAQPRLDLLHPFDRPLEAHGAPQLFRLASGESRRDHRDAQELLLEERHAERALEDRLEARVRILDRDLSLPPVEERMHHAADDRPRPDDRHLHDDVVELLRGVPRQRGHLRAALDLEEPDGVGLVQHPVDLRVVLRQVREVDVDGFVRADHRDHLLDRREHPEA